MSWLVLTILAIFSRAIYGVLTKVLSNNVKVAAMTQTTLLLVVATLWGLLLSPFVGGIHFEHMGQVWWTLTVAIITSAAGNVLYFKGISKLESGTTQVAFSSILIWGAIMASVFLGTTFTTERIVGVSVLLLAIVLAQYQKGTLKFNHGIWLIIASAACFAGFQISSAELSHTLSAGTYLVLTYLGDAVLIGIPFWAGLRKDFISGKATRVGFVVTVVVTGAASVVFNVLAYLAYHIAPNAGIVVLLLTAQVVVAVVLSIIFLKERTNVTHKLMSGVLAVVAAILIKA